VTTTTAATPLTPEHLHARYARRIQRHIGAVLGADNDRDDVAQEVFLTVFLKIGSLRDPACVDGWVARVTANTLKYVMRQRRLRRHASWEGLGDAQEPWTRTNPQVRDLAARALRVLEAMPPSDRALLSSYWFSPATAETIAERAGCSVITVRRRLLKARGRFERLARRDPALSRCIDEAGGSGSRQISV